MRMFACENLLVSKNKLALWTYLHIRESVDSLCRDGADAQYTYKGTILDYCYCCLAGQVMSR